MAHTQNVDEFVSDLEQIGDIVGRPLSEVPAQAAGRAAPMARSRKRFVLLKGAIILGLDL